jgi:hypothetical protein
VPVVPASESNVERPAERLAEADETPAERHEPLEGLALVWSDAVLHPSAEAARAASPRRGRDGRSVRVVRIVADEGAVVKVRTALPDEARHLPALTLDDLTLHASRSQLVAVLREAIVESFEDGSGFVLRPGLAVALEGGSARPLDDLLARLVPTIESDRVGLSFQLPEQPPHLTTALRGESLVCRLEAEGSEKRGARSVDPPTLRVYGRAELRAEEEKRRQRQNTEVPPSRAKVQRPHASDHELAKKASILGTLSAQDGDFMGSLSGNLLMDEGGCALVRSGESDPAKTLHVGGSAFAGPEEIVRAPCTRPIQSHRGPQQGVLVDLRFDHAEVRAASTEAILAAPEPCGTFGAGLRAGSRPSASPKPWVVRGRVPVYFPDGAPAGHHQPEPASYDVIDDRGDLACVEHPNVSTPICFDRKHVTELGTRPTPRDPVL